MSSGQHWYEREPQRMVSESDAMAQRYSRFELKPTDLGNLAWVGYLVSNQSNRYKVAVVYSPRHPHEHPLAYILEPKLRSLHQYGDGSLCLMRNGETWLPMSTAATMVPLIAAWLFAHERHQRKCRRDGGRPCGVFSCPDWPGN